MTEYEGGWLVGVFIGTFSKNTAVSCHECIILFGKTHSVIYKQNDKRYKLSLQPGLWVEIIALSQTSERRLFLASYLASTDN